uniref:NADH-ubiquinone oxidoreductase chain 5 n=1 Tax=Isonychia kiangsinensis TaxID=1470551 RepID=A0A482FJQ2_9INSE|nr:NADH dehydrogenase subunit 5 [Isonychia kiangsinensis]QBO27431.1 NADH dehydrogenase subunit 5 [Isonychia kiangsinensis]
MLWSVSICVISLVFLGLSSLSCFLSGLYFLGSEYVLFIEWEVVSLHSVNIVMTLLLDWMSLIFMSFVLLISSLVIYYSEEYMSGDLNIGRFILLVLMFVLSMMLLIISPNLISILLGWDGLGLVSYCLVIYYQNVKSYNAGMLTALSNRIGDVALLLAIAWMLNFGGFNYVFYLTSMSETWEMTLIGGLVVLAAMTKSAQIPFSAWLPAAMAAPTPVSALVHSSTLVTAGVYLLIRFSPLLSGSEVSSFLLLISGLTMFMAGLGANFEFDLKKIIALSTLSQLGLMMSILSMGFYKLAYFHLLTHALFKALLFMCAGAVIHNMKDSQDIRNMGGIVTQMPYTASCLNVANLALCGMPFLAGFYSKDLILEVAGLSFLNSVSFGLFFFSTGLTMCYSLRLAYYTMTGDFQPSVCHPMNDEGHKMLKGMSGLLIMSVIGGGMLSWVLFPTPVMVCLPFGLKTLALSVSVLGGWVGYEFAKMSVGMSLKSVEWYTPVVFSGSMWYMPFLSTFGVSKVPLWAGSLLVKSMDQGWSEHLGGQGIYASLEGSSRVSGWLQDNDLKVYLTTFILWVIVLLVFMWG